MDNKHNDFINDPYKRAQRVTLNNEKPTQDRTIDRNVVRRKKRGMPLWGIYAVALAGLAVIAFALYYFLAPGAFSRQAAVVASPTASISTATPRPTPTATPTPTPSPTPSPSPTPTPDPSMWGAKFPDKFTDGEVVKADNSYKSGNIDVTVTKLQKDNVTYYVADIYIKDLKYFRTAFANDKYTPNGGNHQFVDDMGKDNNAVLAINGDYYTDNPGPIFKNGVPYRSQTYRDVLVMYNDGTMQTFLKGTFNMKDEESKGVWQMWTFGPELLDSNGQPMTKFNSSVTRANPRMAVGYYEPGHYCFVAVDGRPPQPTNGYTMTQLSQLFFDKGCKVAFNLDGGGSAAMAFMGNIVNQPCGDYRKVDDILYITDTSDDTKTTAK